MDAARDASAPVDASSEASAPDAATPPAVVDNSTLTNKLIVGYQGWFSTEGDGGPFNRWLHWSRETVPNAMNVTFDAWPDTSELDPAELHDTGFHYADGRVARLFSSHDRRTVHRHFRWMRDYSIDGAFLQRFVGELRDPSALAFRDAVTGHVRTGCESYGRVFAIEYDISGASEATVVDDLRRDWMHMVDDLRVTESDRYLRHRGRPVLGLWGFGFNDRVGTPAQATQFLDWIERDAPERYRATVMGGVPSRWRTLTADSKTDPAWAAVYRRFPVINPWMVGRFATDTDVQSYRRTVVDGDIAEARRVGADYMPVVFPGFSWAHLMPANPINQIPRRGGAFLWRQLFEFSSAGSTMMFGAMFDEVDEGTAMFKLARTAADAPRELQWLTLDIDGTALPSDWYLRLLGEGTRMLRGEIPRTATIPIRP